MRSLISLEFKNGPVDVSSDVNVVLLYTTDYRSIILLISVVREVSLF